MLQHIRELRQKLQGQELLYAELCKDMENKVALLQEAWSQRDSAKSDIGWRSNISTSCSGHNMNTSSSSSRRRKTSMRRKSRP